MNPPKSNILLKSKELFERFGYQKTTLTDIAKSVGKVKTAIYYYFNGKEEIFAQLVQMEAESFLKRLTTKVSEKADSKQKLQTYIETRVMLMQNISSRYNFLKQEFFELMPIVEENRKETDLLEIAFVEKILEEGMANEEFEISSVTFAANMLVNTLKGLEIQMYVTDKIVVKEAEMENFKNFLLYGILNK